MLTEGHPQLSLKGHADQRRFSRTARKQKSYFQEGGSSKLWAGQPHLESWGSDEQKNLGTISLTYGVKEGDWEQSAWIYEGRNHI